MKRRVLAAVSIVAASLASGARGAPPGFADLPVGTGWNIAVGVGFAPANGIAAGRMFVWEKGGTVWAVENGIKAPAPLIDISQEVGNWGDFGLLGFAVDPNFSVNGYVYLLYVVDYHHAKYFGTSQYNPGANQYNHDTIGRVTRYTARAADGFRSVDYSSRRVLLGESLTTGIPICHLSHGVGALVFGRDGTLLVSCGDGASYETTDSGGPISGSSNTALADGIITVKEDVGAFRAQLVDSLSGKILRLDPATGNGVPSNPFYDTGAPRSARSRVWALGLRNPYRMCIRPGTGSLNPADGRPGDICFGDVGWYTWEEFDICASGGRNFGWPLFEGLTATPSYQATGTLNQDAPNPLNGAGGCTQPYFRFKDLCIQDTLAPSFPNPCNAGQQVPAAIPHFVHARPVLDWKHATGPARTGIYNGSNAAEINVGAPGSPVAGISFPGNCATGGAWYTGITYPAEYQNTYFLADFGEGWIHCLVFNGARLVEVKPFVPGGSGNVVCVATHPVTGDLYYIKFSPTGKAEVRQIAYFGTANQPPTAVGSATPAWGATPLTVQFDGSASSDPEHLPLLYDWDFGDGSPHSSQARPVHIYAAGGGARCLTARLTVTDLVGAKSVADVAISPDNTPPNLVITSPRDGAKYSLWRTYSVPLTATVTDAEHGPGQLTCSWQTILHHSNHVHPEPSDPHCSSVATVTTHGDDCLDYYYEFRLTVTDAACLSTTRSVVMYPNCCRPDFNNDGFVDGIDSDEFNVAFAAGDPAADYNADQFLDGIDYDQFNADFEAGCP